MGAHNPCCLAVGDDRHLGAHDLSDLPAARRIPQQRQRWMVSNLNPIIGRTAFALSLEKSASKCFERSLDLGVVGTLLDVHLDSGNSGRQVLPLNRYLRAVTYRMGS